MYILDTNIVSRTSPLASEDWAVVRAWVRAVSEVSFLSVVSLAELEFGATRLKMRGSTRRADQLDAWIDSVVALFANRILPVDQQIARRTGELLAQAEAGGYAPGFEDACIAATAEVHHLTVVTHNSRHFAIFGVPFQKPGQGNGA